MSNEMDAEGLKAARRLAQWELGDPSWASLLIGAYLNPAATNLMLDEEES